MKALSRGFSPVEIIIVITIVAVIGGLGYVAYKNISSNQLKSDSSAETTQSAPTEETPVKVESTKDLDTVTTQLDDIAIDDSDSASFDQAVEGF